MAGLFCCAILLSLYHIGYDLLQLGLLVLLAVNYASTYSVIDAMHAQGALLRLLTSLNGTALIVLFGLFAVDVMSPVLRLDGAIPSVSAAGIPRS